ncbi:MAG: putative RNA uridine N3 methyltransferase, partial [Nitrososphaerales archaeon]
MISIAIPDSMFLDDDSLREKTVKVGEIARSAAIFGVERIYIYRDGLRNYDTDYETAKMIFQYAETPQYLRRSLLGKRKQLEFVGLLAPLRTPHHLKEAQPKIDEIRDAVIFMQNGELVADIGAKEFAKYESRGQEGQRVTIRVRSLTPLSVELAQKPEGTYWGYEVRRAPS